MILPIFFSCAIQPPEAAESFPKYDVEQLWISRWISSAAGVCKPVLLGGCHGDQCRAQHPVGDQVTHLQHSDHGIGLLLGWYD